MYAYIKGMLADAGIGYVVVEAGGIGYNISVPASLAGETGGIGSDIKLYTYLSVREDAMQLFGFMTKDELLMFRQLINVSGIGPKAGLSILGVLTPREIRLAVMNSDAKTIARAPGIGGKTAQKVIIELKDKIDDEELILDIVESGQPQGRTASPAARDAIDALIALGYTPSDADRAVRESGAGEDDDTQTILKKALKEMAAF